MSEKTQQIQGSIQAAREAQEAIADYKFDPTVASFAVLDKRRNAFEFVYFTEMKSLREFARQMGMAPSTVHKWTQERGIKLRDMVDAQKARYLQEDKAGEIVRLRVQEKLTLDEIAHRMGYQGRSGVSSVLKRRGVRGKCGE